MLFLALVASSHADGALQHVALVCSLMAVFLVYPTTMETLTRGRSPGKLAIGLRVVRDDGGTVTAQQAFVRALVAVPEIYAFSGGPAFFSCLLSQRGKRMGDYAAGTYVVRDRVALRLPPPVPMPPALADWAARADLRTPPVGLALATRQYLSRLSHPRPGVAAAGRRAARDPDVGVRRAPPAAGHLAVGLPGRGGRRTPRARPRPPPPRRGAEGPADRAVSRSPLRAPGDVLVHLRRARDHADRHYAEPLDLAALAEVAGLSKYHFHRLFAATYGRSPAAYLSERRIERAQDLLRATNLTVTEICHAVGFSSLGSFSSTFRRIVGRRRASSSDATRTAHRTSPAATSSWSAWSSGPQARRSESAPRGS